MVGKPNYLKPNREGRERWLISYTDILTLLLILFIAVAAQSLAKSQARAGENSAKPPAPPAQEAPRAAASAEPANKTPITPTPAMARAEQRLKERGLDLRREERGLIISLPQAVLFASGDDRINPTAISIVSGIADVLRDLDNKVELAGHADSVPIHNRRFRNNWELSSARGLSLLNTLTRDYGIDESRLTVSSHGSYSPKTSNDTPEGRADNRRVEILILDNPQ